MIIREQARQAEPRSLATGEQVNQLTGPLPHHYPEIQGHGDFIVEMIPEDKPAPRVRPVSASFAQSAHPDIVVEKVAETHQPERFEDEPRAKQALGSSARGESHGRAKLSAGEVQQIRLLAEGGEWTVSALARAFDISRAAIRKVIKGVTWNDDMWIDTRYV